MLGYHFRESSTLFDVRREFKKIQRKFPRGFHAGGQYRTFLNTIKTLAALKTGFSIEVLKMTACFTGNKELLATGRENYLNNFSAWF